MPPEGFHCRQCGHCCINLDAHRTCATDGDVAIWQANGRDDILEWVDETWPGVYDIWVNPRTGEDAGRCPWLRKLPRRERYICRIQAMKPGRCRKYPVSKEHAEETGCGGFGKDGADY